MQININIDRIINTAKLKRALRSKTMIGSVIFAIALWVYTSLNGEYNTTVKVPLFIDLPSNRSLEEVPTDNITVKVFGTGWQLFNLYFFNSSKNCFLDYTNHDFRVDDNIVVTRNDLLNSLTGMINVESRDVNPTTIEIKTGLLQSKYVRIKPNIRIKTREGFMVVGDIELEPDSVLINGNIKALNLIDFWETEALTINNIFSPVNSEIALKDTLEQIELDITTVKYMADVQQIAEITVPDVVIDIRGGSLPLGHTIKPNKIDVTIYGGVDQVVDFDQSSINAFIDVSEIKTDTTGIIKVNVNYPNDVKLLRIKPPYVYHTKNVTGIK